MAIVVALKLWTRLIGPSTAFELRSDSLGALSALAKKSSKAIEINKIIAEISLLEAETGVVLILCEGYLEVPFVCLQRTNAISEVPLHGSTLSDCHEVQSMIVQSSRHGHIPTFPQQAP